MNLLEISFATRRTLAKCLPIEIVKEREQVEGQLEVNLFLVLVYRSKNFSCVVYVPFLSDSDRGRGLGVLIPLHLQVRT